MGEDNGISRARYVEEPGVPFKGAGPEPQHGPSAQPREGDRPQGARRVWNVVGLLARCRFADAVEMANSGDTEN